MRSRRQVRESTMTSTISHEDTVERALSIAEVRHMILYARTKMMWEEALTRSLERWRERMVHINEEYSSNFSHITYRHSLYGNDSMLHHRENGRTFNYRHLLRDRDRFCALAHDERRQSEPFGTAVFGTSSSFGFTEGGRQMSIYNGVFCRTHRRFSRYDITRYFGCEPVYLPSALVRFPSSGFC